MRRTIIQQRIIPRNYLFGRITYIVGNLSSMINKDRNFFTLEEIKEMKTAFNILKEVLKKKKERSEEMKVLLKK